MRAFVLVGSVLTTAALLVAACGSDTTTPTATPSPTGPAPTSPASPTSTPPSPAPSGAGAAAYFVRDGGAFGGPFLAPVWVGEAGSPMDAVEALLSGPESVLAGTGFATTGLSTAVPEGTELLDLTVNDGTASVDLSGAFDDGGGSASMFARLAQIVYTATQFDDVDEVELLLDGTAVEVFSSEGLVIDGPLTRDDSLESGVVPKLFPDRPAYGQTVGTTFTLTGVARDLFEATFVYEVLDDADATLAGGPVTALGSQGWNAFDQSVTVTVDGALRASVVVSESSAEDGSTIFELSVPIAIDPAVTTGG